RYARPLRKSVSWRRRRDPEGRAQSRETRMNRPSEPSSVRGIAALAGDGRALGGALLAVACAVAGFAVRYGFVEPVALGEACEGSGLWWCPLRTGLIVFTQWGGFGWIALVAGAAALAALAARLAAPA